MTDLCEFQANQGCIVKPCPQIHEQSMSFLSSLLLVSCARERRSSRRRGSRQQKELAEELTGWAEKTDCKPAGFQRT
jgi:hypothetical protein